MLSPRSLGMLLALCVAAPGCVTEDDLADQQLSLADADFELAADPDAAGVSLLARLCFEVETAWVDSIPLGTPGGGDYWQYNENRPPIGARVTIGGTVRHLGTDGCVTFAPPPGTYTVTLESTGTVNGIDITSYTDWVPDGPDADSRPDLSGNFVLASSTWVRSGPAKETLVLPASDINDSIAWHPYVLMAYAMTRSTMHLGDHGNASGCGPADVPCCGHVEWGDTDDDHDDVSPTELISYTMRQGSGYASTWSELDTFDGAGDKRVSGYGSLFGGGDSDAVANSIPALGSGHLSRWQMAHELGHMLVMQRTGGREETNYSAALYDCMGQYWKGDLSLPSDTGATNEKAQLTREFSSGAAREGWADFYAAQLFNDIGEYDCWYKLDHYMDFDLDGDIDNDYPGNTYADGVFTCEGAGVEPSLGEPDASDPVASWINARDWLDEVWNNNACGDPASPSQITGRSSQYDWLRYFWDMATDEGVPVEELSDIYVDMCPTNWVAGPPDAIPDANWPELRLERAADHHGHGAAHDQQKNNGVAHL